MLSYYHVPKYGDYYGYLYHNPKCDFDDDCNFNNDCNFDSECNYYLYFNLSHDSHLD